MLPEKLFRIFRVYLRRPYSHDDSRIELFAAHVADVCLHSYSRVYQPNAVSKWVLQTVQFNGTEIK